MTAHYFQGNGWTFLEWEPEVQDKRLNGEPADVDLRFAAPGGTAVHLQVKSSDRPGVVAAGRIVDGENDEHVCKGLKKAACQLPSPGTGPAMIVLSAQRRWGLAGTPEVVESITLGSTRGYEGKRVLLHEQDRGLFSTGWQHVSAVVMLDYRRSVERFDYACTVLVNPWAAFHVYPEWFPHARILILDGDRFVWKRGQPVGTYFPDGTQITRSAVQESTR